MLFIRLVIVKQLYTGRPRAMFGEIAKREF